MTFSDRSSNHSIKALNLEDSNHDDLNDSFASRRSRTVLDEDDFAGDDDGDDRRGSLTIESFSDEPQEPTNGKATEVDEEAATNESAGLIEPPSPLRKVSRTNLNFDSPQAGGLMGSKRQPSLSKESLMVDLLLDPTQQERDGLMSFSTTSLIQDAARSFDDEEEGLTAVDEGDTMVLLLGPTGDMEQKKGSLTLDAETPTKERRKKRRSTKRRRSSRRKPSRCSRLRPYRNAAIAVMVSILLAIILSLTLMQRKRIQKGKHGGKPLSSSSSQQNTSIDSPDADIFKTNGFDKPLLEPHPKDHPDDPVDNETCKDNAKFRHNNEAGKNCRWVARQDTLRRCTKEGVLENCPATCDPTCTAVGLTTFPTEYGTAAPTESPTYIVTSDEILSQPPVFEAYGAEQISSYTVTTQDFEGEWEEESETETSTETDTPTDMFETEFPTESPTAAP